ncbi:hypothetical protein [Kiloniella litopenaei]|uniref:hypothetical protein n=1 Tax=Kiloniella litopenaei TaxID=1549748 RepID=UPI003BAC04EA
MKQILGLISFVLVLLSASTSIAYIYGGTNFSYNGYPDHTCRAPYSKPVKPYTFNYQWEIDQYNSEVEKYNFELKRYFNCIEEYVDSASNDIERIKEKANDAIYEAKAL